MADSSDEKGGAERTKSSKRRSSLFSGNRLSFIRSKGERGANVATLRGTTGSDFEASARVIRTDALGISCCCFGGGGDKSEKKVRFVLIKGSSCFVFKSDDAPSPKYAILLAHMKAEIHPPHGSHTTVSLMMVLGDTEYKFIFDSAQDKDAPQNFVNAVVKGASIGQDDEIKVKLGHTDQMKKGKRKSTLYADEVAKKKVEDQPEAPHLAQDIVNQYNTTAISQM